MRAIACWPIQYLTAFGMASQSPGYFPNAVYIPAQMIRKRIAAVTIGPDRAAAQRRAPVKAACGRGPRGAVAVRTRHQTA